MLQEIGWDTLHERRAKSRLAMPFRIAHNLVDITAADHLQTNKSRKGNAAKFRVSFARTVAYRHGFFPDVTRMWNALPSDMVTAGSLDVLKKDYLCSRSESEHKHTSVFVYNILSSITLFFNVLLNNYTEGPIHISILMTTFNLLPHACAGTTIFNFE